MSNPKDRIKAGLDSIEREKSGAQFNLSNLAGAPASVSDLNTLAQQATQKRDRLKHLASGVLSAVEKHREKKTSEFAELGKVRTDSGSIIDELGDNRRRTMLEREISRYRRDALKISQDERAKLLSELRDITQKISAVKDSWSDPIAVLHRRTIADPNRSVIAQNLRSAGPVALENTIRDGITSQNAAQVMAAIDAYEALPKESKKLVRFSSKRDIAESLVQISEEFKAANQFISMSELAHLEADLANSEASGDRSTPAQKIKAGILKEGLAKMLGVPVESLNTNPGDDPTGSIRKTETLQERLDRTNPGVKGSSESLNWIGG